jgi:hypothetical protein
MSMKPDMLIADGAAELAAGADAEASAEDEFEATKTGALVAAADPVPTVAVPS